MFTAPPVAPDVRRIDDLIGVSQILKFPAGQSASVVAVLHESDVEDEPIRLGALGELSFDGPFVPAGRGARRWATRARLRTSRSRLARRTRVEVEISLWASDLGELTIRPTARAPHAWGFARLQRYGELARLAADELERRALDIGRRVAVPAVSAVPEFDVPERDELEPLAA